MITKTKIGIALFGCLILGVMMLANSPLEAKNSENNNKPEYVHDEIIVKFKGDNNKPFRVIKVPEGRVEETIKAYKGKAHVVYAEPNYILYADAAPADTHYTDWQWALNNTGQRQPRYFNRGTPGADINWEPAWTDFKASLLSETIIAILDTGIDASHPDLNDKLIDGYNAINDTTNTDDIYGHGTHVAGISGAETNNWIGIAGVAFPDNVKIMPVKVLGDTGSSTAGSVAKGIIWATDNGAKVINLSLGGASFSETLELAVNHAWDNGVLIAASAGNDGNSTLRYPASYDNVMSVAATDNKDDRASFSNFNDEIDISAPGVDVLSTYPNNGYASGNGTSMSCPHIAGLAGLLFAQDNMRTNAEVRTIIEQSADDLGSAGRDNYFGHGRINVHAALTYSPCDENNPCESEKICCLGECITPTCSGDSDCDDGNNCTIDSCVNPGTCDAYCANTWPDCGIEDGCCGPNCTSAIDSDCLIDPCSNCFRGICDGKCHPRKEGLDCPDCQY